MTREQRRAKAQRLHEDGKTVREIADQLGVSVGTAHRDVNPDAEERYLLGERERKRRSRQGRQDENYTEVSTI